jgi:hypothetical protein
MPDLAWWLQNFKESAFRLETLPAYDSPRETEMLAAFMRGEIVRLPDDFAWLRTVKSHCTSGKTMQRVRIVRQPLTDYERFELSLYPQNIEAGEDIRICTDTMSSPDFWIFDSHTAYILNYDVNGGFVGVDIAEDVVTYRRIRDLALENSVPFADYARAARR